MKKLVVSVIAIIVGAILLKPFALWGFDVVDPLDFGDATSVSAISNDLNENPYENISDSYKSAPATTSNVTSYAKTNTTYANRGNNSGKIGYGSVSYDSITITGKTLPVISVGDTTVDAGNHVNRYGDRFYYGHNSSAVFGGLSGVGVGTTFSIASSGVTYNYRVAKRVVFEKNSGNGRLQLGGKGNYMKSVAAAKYGGVQYSISIMTCAGTSYGNGDASHRLVLFANRI